VAFETRKFPDCVLNAQFDILSSTVIMKIKSPKPNKSINILDNMKQAY
jgi:hypothetical protein